MTITTGDKFIPEVWSGKVVYAAESRLVMKPLCTEYSGFSTGDEGFGDVIHIPKISDLTAYDKTASTQVTLNAITEGEETLTINVHKECSYLIEDRLAAVALGAYLNHYSKKAGYAIAKAIDTSLASLYSGLSQYVGDGSTKITDANIIRASWYLDKADAPAEDRALVTHSHGKADMLEIDDFTDYEKTGRERKELATPFGEILAIPVYHSNNIQVAAGTPTVVHNLFFHKEAFGFAMPTPPRPQNEYKLEWLGWLYVVDTIYGVAEIRDTFAVDFRSKERT